MGHFVSFPEAEGPERVERLVLNLVDPAVDAGAVGQLISLSLSPLDGGAAALFNSDPLIDYRSQRPLMNYKDGRLVDMRRSGIVLSHASDVEGQPFLHLHGAEPDFQWDALLADMIDIIERFGVKSTFSFTAVPSATPHTRPADMVVRTADKREGQVFEADFWFTAGFADYVEFHTAKLGISHTNVAVRVPVYLAGDRYFTGAAGALGLTSSLSGLYFPLGDLEQAAAEEVEAYSSAIEGNEELAQFIDKLEKDYDANGSVRGYVTAPKPELRVPTVDEIGRAAEQFLAGVSSPRASASEKTFDPQGLLRKMERYQGFLPGEPGVGEGPAFDVSAMRGQQAGGGAEAPERSADDEGNGRDSAQEAADAPAAESPEGAAAESAAASAEGLAVGENEAGVAEDEAEAPENEAGVAESVELEGNAVAEAEAGVAVGFESDEDLAAVSEGSENDAGDVAVADNVADVQADAGEEADALAESDTPAESDALAEADAARDRVDVADFDDADVVPGELRGESGLETRGESDPRDGASNLGDDLDAAFKREDQEEASQAGVEADSAGEFESAAEAGESEADGVYGREAYDVGEAGQRGENDGLYGKVESYGQAESYGHVRAEELAEAHAVGAGESADNEEPGEVLDSGETLEPLSALGRIKAFLKNLPDVPDPSEQNGETGEVLDPSEALEPLSASEDIDVAEVESSGWNAPENHVQDFGENGAPGEDAEDAADDGVSSDAVDAGSEDTVAGFEAAAAETEADAGLLITESEVIESMMGDSAEQPSSTDGAPAETSAEHVSVVDAALADSAMAGPPSEAGSVEDPEAWERPNELEPPVSFDSAGSFDSSGPLESPSAFGGPNDLPAGEEGMPQRQFEGVSFTTGDGGQAAGYEADASEEGFLPSGVQSGGDDAWPVRGWDEALGFGSDAVVPQEDANAPHNIVFAPHVFGAAMSAEDTPGHSALERMQTLVLKDSPEADALAAASSERAEQEASSELPEQDAPAKADGEALASDETAPDGAGNTGQNPESPGEGEPSGDAADGAAANEIGVARDPGAAPTASVPNEADPLGGVGADPIPPAGLPSSNVEQLPDPGQGQVKRRRGKHSA